jgi:hypothetical protein
VSEQTVGVFMNEFEILVEKTETSNGGCFWLTRTSPIESFPEKVQKLLNLLYNSTHYKNRVLGTIVNAICTEKRITFMFSKRLLNQLLVADGKAELSGQDYKWVNAYYFDERVLEVDRPYQDGKRMAKVVSLAEKYYEVFTDQFPDTPPRVWLDNSCLAIQAFDKKVHNNKSLKTLMRS